MVDQALMIAPEEDDTNSLLLKFLSSSKLSQEESLLKASRCNSVKFVKEVMTGIDPGLVFFQDKDGNSPLLVASEKGNTLIVEALINHYPQPDQLCGQKDKEGRGPFHLAAKAGRVDVLRTLLRVFPVDWLEREDFHGQTALQLALQESQFASFKFMMKKLLGPGAPNLALQVLKHQDNDGNTVLHIATGRKQTQILRYLLENNPTGSSLVEVDKKNNIGLTALALHYKNSLFEHEVRIIRKLLNNAGATEDGSPVTPVPFFPESGAMMSLTTLAVILTVFVLIATSTFVSLSFYPSIYMQSHTVVTNATSDLPYMSLLNPLPNGFYFLTIALTTFILAMLIIVALIWFIVHPWMFYLRAASLFSFTTMVIIGGLIVKELVPSFYVAGFGSHEKISSLSVLWLHVVGLIVILPCLCLVVKLFICLHSHAWHKRRQPTAQKRASTLQLQERSRSCS